MKIHVLALLATALAVACSSQKDDETKVAQRLVFKPDHDFSPDLAPPAPDETYTCLLFVFELELLVL